MTPYPGKIDLPEHINYWKMDAVAVNMLNFLYNLEPFDTVISSSWKKYCSKEQVQDLFETNGLILHLVLDWCTENLDSRRTCTRASEIELYLNDHPEITDYFIIDDLDSGSSLQKPHNKVYSYDNIPHKLDHDRIFIVDYDMGISPDDYRKMRILFTPEPLSNKYDYLAASLS